MFLLQLAVRAMLDRGVIIVVTPNENKMSCREQGCAWLLAKVRTESKLIIKSGGVGSIAWLDPKASEQETKG
jgi:hypothetical protein